MRVVNISPTRFTSRRFPGKPLADISNRTIVEKVYRQAKKSRVLEEVINLPFVLNFSSNTMFLDRGFVIAQ